VHFENVEGNLFRACNLIFFAQMASSSRASPSKRALETAEDDGEGKSQEKRARIASYISEVSEQDEVESTNVAKEETEGNSPTVVIYELSSDNDESLCGYFMSGFYREFY
jgi:hypothetical protein